MKKMRRKSEVAWTVIRKRCAHLLPGFKVLSLDFVPDVRTSTRCRGCGTGGLCACLSQPSPMGPDPNIKPWLLTIAANRCRTFLSKRSKRPVPTEFASELAVSQSPEQVQDLSEELQKAINLLREDHRTCFILFHQESMSCQEIAKILERPEGTIKTWLHRSRQELASTLRQRGIVPEVRHESR